MLASRSAPMGSIPPPASSTTGTRADMAICKMQSRQADTVLDRRLVINQPASPKSMLPANMGAGGTLAKMVLTTSGISR